MRRGAQALIFAAAIALTGCTNSSTRDGQEQQGQQEQSTRPSQTPSASGSAAQGGTSAATPGGDGISLDDAAGIVTDQYGGEVIGVEDDDYRGTAAWEVEVRDSSEGRIEVKVDKSTGEILDVEHDS